MADVVSRIPVFRVQPTRYTLAGIFSVALHGMLALGALGLARQSHWVEPLRSPARYRQPYSVRYLMLLPPPPAPATRPATPRVRQSAPAPEPHVPPLTGAVATPTLPERSPGAGEPLIQTEEIGPGEVAATAGAGSSPIAYAHTDQRDAVTTGGTDPEGPDGRTLAGFGDQPGSNQVAELIGPAAGACPALRRADSEHRGQVIVSIGFDVDDHGVVDPKSLHVVQSPAKPRTEHRLYGHMYAVAIGARLDRALPDADPVYDSVVTRDVRQHIAGLQFRPATRDGIPIRSSVLVSCQSS